MVCLFARDATDFTTNGLKILQPVSCIVKEEINGGYSLEITMPMWDTSIQPEMIIRAPTPKGDQLFRVYKPTVDAMDDNSYQCRHIFYDLLDYFIEDIRPTCATGAQALTAILSGTGFAGESDIAEQSTADYQMMSPVRAILGGNGSDDNAFANRWGGEIERDNHTVRMLSRVGADRGVSIRYRKNLTGLTLETDMSNVVTRIYPTGRQANGQTLLTLPEKYIDSPVLDSYVRPKIARYDYDKIQIVDKTDDDHPNIVTQAQAQQQLRDAVASDFMSGIDRPTVSANVEFVPLETTEEYKSDGLAALEKVYIGDTVHINHEPLGIDMSARVVSYEYDCLAQRYNVVTLGSVQEQSGTVQSTIGQIATGAQQAADSAQQSADEAKQEVELANVTIGNLTVRVTATESGLSSKVDAGDVSSIVRQSPQDVIYAFNNKDGSTQKVRFTGDGFDFYNGSAYIGHMGISGNHLDFTLGDGVSIQWNASSAYAMQWYPYDQTDGQEGGFHCGNVYPKYLNMKGGNIMNVGTLQASDITNSSGTFRVNGHAFQVTRMTTGDGKIYNALLESAT